MLLSELVETHVERWERGVESTSILEIPHCIVLISPALDFGNVPRPIPRCRATIGQRDWNWIP